MIRSSQRWLGCSIIISLCLSQLLKHFGFSLLNPTKMKFCTLFFSALFAVLFLSCVLVDEGSLMVSAHHHRNEGNIMEILAAGLVVKLLQEMNHHHGR
ncbi:hypothetical protein NPIL_80061 [Nephila pilipes]|uniref:Uncharacterized protein n=1 Tax=Nephila pilipes TaxID=299642 RepID=A0A8X6Q138_NEPPI|nr:hypothetical protein NPIL_80061 [Nephila pilipes]